MIAQKSLAAALAALGASAVAIGTGIFLMGPAAVANAIAAALRPLGLGGEVGGLSTPDADNEMRFYSVLWIAYGVIAIRVARSLPASLKTAQLLLALFFAGGAGRALSMASVVAPHPLFVFLMWIELLASPALLLLSWRVKLGAAR
jgi:hypothetical protein